MAAACAHVLGMWAWPDVGLPGANAWLHKLFYYIMTIKRSGLEDKLKFTARGYFWKSAGLTFIFWH